MRPWLSLVPAALWAQGCSFSALSDEAQLRLETFDRYAAVLDSSYPFFGQKGIDWEEVVERYRSAVVYATRPVDFYHLLAGMLSELGDPHVALDVPEANLAADGAPAVSLRWLPGLRIVRIGRDLYVESWPEGAEPVPPEDLAGAAATLPRVLRVEGFPVVHPLVENLFRGPSGSPVELDLEWSDGTVTRHVLHRPAVVDAPALPAGVLEAFRARSLREFDDLVTLDESGSVPWLRLRTLDSDDVELERKAFVERVDALVDRVLDAPALILDLRDNRGGQLEVTTAVAGRFLPCDVTLVLGVQRKTRFAGLLETTYFGHDRIERREPVYGGHVIVCIASSTNSAAEHLARLLQRDAGATVIGEASAGAEALVSEVQGGDGSTLRFGSLRLLDVKGRGLQDLGVVPDVSVAFDVEDVRAVGHAAAHADWERRLLRAAEAAIARRGRSLR